MGRVLTADKRQPHHERTPIAFIDHCHPAVISLCDVVVRKDSPSALAHRSCL
jgi:hypothetical protein